MLLEINRLAERTAKREKVVVRRRDIIHAKSKSFNDIIVMLAGFILSNHLL